MNGRHILIGCGVFCAIGLLAAGVGVAFLWHVVEDPKGVVVSIEGPKTVALTEEFTVTVVVQNQRAKSVFDLTDVDISEEYLNNFLVLDTTPVATSNEHVPLVNKRSYKFNHPINAGESARFAFHLRPVKAGLYQGDVDVNEGMKSLSTQVQTLVEARKAP